jgi:hypothetical protein
MTNGKYQLVLSEIYNETIHGLSNHVDYDINTHYLIIETFGYGRICYDTDDSTDEYYISGRTIISSINKIAMAYNRRYTKIKRLTHSILRNYANIIVKKNYIKPEIAECIYLKNNEYIAILKTFWIRLVQRTWKRVFNERHIVILKRKSPVSLNYRLIHGKWPNNCNYLPSLYGMLKI